MDAARVRVAASSHLVGHVVRQRVAAGGTVVEVVKPVLRDLLLAHLVTGVGGSEFACICRLQSSWLGFWDIMRIGASSRARARARPRIGLRIRLGLGLGLVADRLLRRVGVGVTPVVGVVILGDLAAGELDIRTAVLAAAGERAEAADLVRVVRFL